MKKFKKIFASLMSFTTLSAIPITLISCSSQPKTNNDSEQKIDSPSTTIKKTIDAKSINFNNKTYEDAKTLINNEFVYNNLSSFITSGHELITSKDDIVIEILESQNQPKNSIQIKLTIKGSKWIKDNDIQSQDYVETITIDGLYIQIPIDQLPDKSEVEQTNGDLKEDGGNLNNSQLHVSKYKSVIQYLNLNSNDLIFTYTNELLNKKLHQEAKFTNLTLKILDGSSSANGLLKLHLSGQYNNKNIDSEIDITNFYSFKENEFFNITNAEINLINWFNDKQPITQQKLNINSSDLIEKYLSQLQIKDSNNNFYNIETIRKYFSKLVFDTKIENNILKISLSSQSKFSHMKYSNEGWNNESEINIQNSSISENINVNLPTIDDLKMIMLNQLVLDNEYISKFHSSYFLGTQNFLKDSSLEFTDKNIVKNKDQVVDKYKSYFQNNLMFFNISNVNSDDEHGKVSFNINLKNANSDDVDNLIGKNYTFTNLKTIESFLNIENNNITIKTDSTLYKKIYSFLNTKKNEIISMTEGHFSNYVIPKTNTTNYHLFFDSWDQFNSVFQSLKKDYNPKIFNKDFDIKQETSINNINNNEIGFTSSLYKYDNDDYSMFVIKSISYIFQSNLEITRQGNGFDVELYGTTQIGFANNVEKEYPTTFYMKILNFDKRK